MSAAETPRQIADFEVQQRLGSGGMAEVFLAKKQGAEGTFKQLVIKRVLPQHGSERAFRNMFVEEAHLATRLNHPNIVQVYEFGDDEKDGLFLAMEYVEGSDLGRLARAARLSGRRIDPYVASFIVAEAAKGLHYAHERCDERGQPLAIVHRDVSPQNILVSRDGVVKIADFGIASVGLWREEVGVLKGKFSYMSPEQARGEKVDRRSDVFGLGVVLYELLTQRSPYGALKEEALLEAVRKGHLAPLDDESIPPELEGVLMRALSTHREHRFATARELAAAVARIILSKQELVDDSSVSRVMKEILDEEGLPPLPTPAPARDEEATRASLRAIQDPRAPSADPGSGLRLVREVRHVAMLRLQLDGLEAFTQKAAGTGLRRVRERLRGILDDMAFKRGARWSWESDQVATGLVGLLENPARAAADAARLACDIHEALAGASADLGDGLSASIAMVRGVASGERNRQGHLVNPSLQEPAPSLCRELAARTPLGKTWVAAGLYRLVRREFSWTEAPDLEPDEESGRSGSGTMRVFQLDRALAQDERSGDVELGTNDLVGRDAEKADLHAAFHAAMGASRSMPPEAEGQQGSLVRGALVSRIVLGELGIGKTALVGSFLSELPAGTRHLRVECSPVREELPLGTVSELVRAACGLELEATPEQAERALRELMMGESRPSVSSGHAVRHLVELATGRRQAASEDDASDDSQAITLSSLRLLLAAIAVRRPVVVVLDSLQWADRSSLELLRALLLHPLPYPVLALLLTRPDERVSTALEGFLPIELRGLSAEHQVRLVQARLGVSDGVQSACSDIIRRVAGNPFFMIEMVDALLERGALAILDQGRGVQALARNESDDDGRLPSTLEQLLRDRLRELPANEREVLEWLSVAGGPLRIPDLLELTRMHDDESLVRLCARGLCDRRGDAMDVRLPLVRDVAYGGLDASQRTRSHRRLGECLSATPLAQGLSAALIAQHLALGQAPMTAATYYLKAGHAARSKQQAALAASYFERALELLPRGAVERLSPLEALEGIHRYLGRRSARLAVLAQFREAAQASAQAHWVALAIARSARCCLDEGQLDFALESGRAAVRLCREANLPALEVEVRVLLTEVQRDRGDMEDAFAQCEQALRTVHEAGLPLRLRAELLRNHGVLLRYLGRIDEAVDAYAESIALFRATGARRSEARTRNSLAFAMFVMERYEDAIALGASSLELDLSFGGRLQVAKTLSNIGQSFARLGDVALGLDFLERARRSHERFADQDSHADTLFCGAAIFLEHDQIADAEEWAVQGSSVVTLAPRVYDQVHEALTRALLARAKGDANSAAVYARAARAGAQSGALAGYYSYATAIEAASTVALGALDEGVGLARAALTAASSGGVAEYGLEVRALCLEALDKGGAGDAQSAREEAMACVNNIAARIRDPRLKLGFLGRPVVRRIQGSSGAAFTRSPATTATIHEGASA